MGANMNLSKAVMYIGAIVGLSTLLIGLFAILQPKPMSKKFGIEAEGKALPYVISTGVRDIFIGFTVLLLFFRHDYLELGLIMFCLGLVAIADFLVVRKNGDRKTSLVHLCGAVAVFIYGFWLLNAMK
jgi:hypothetical protein